MIARLAPAVLGAALLLSGLAHAQAAATKTTTARHYDCSKAGNANKAACKGAAATTTTTVATPAAAPTAAPMQSTAMHTRATSTTTTMKGGDKPTHAGGPNGATAQCKDGTYSKSTHHSGTCSGHKGVATWY